MDLSYPEFIELCEMRRLVVRKQIADTFGISRQTLHNWEVRWRDEARTVPWWVPYALVGVDLLKMSGFEPTSAERMTAVEFNNACHDLGLSGSPEIAAYFGVSRQTAWSWISSNGSGPPTWMSLVVSALEHLHENDLNVENALQYPESEAA